MALGEAQRHLLSRVPSPACMEGCSDRVNTQSHLCRLPKSSSSSTALLSSDFNTKGSRLVCSPAFTSSHKSTSAKNPISSRLAEFGLRLVIDTAPPSVRHGAAGRKARSLHRQLLPASLGPVAPQGGSSPVSSETCSLPSLPPIQSHRAAITLGSPLCHGILLISEALVHVKKRRGKGKIRLGSPSLLVTLHSRSCETP